MDDKLKERNMYLAPSCFPKILGVMIMILDPHQI